MTDEFKPVMEHSAFVAACKRADEAMKRSNGHQFVHILKTRCEICGRSPRQKGRCVGWFKTFLSHLSRELTGLHGLEL